MLDRARDYIQQSTYFRVRLIDGESICDGLTDCVLGHQIDRGPDSNPDGIFVEWHWKNDVLTVHSDRYGMYPAFY